jgi:hypothetical protein
MAATKMPGMVAAMSVAAVAVAMVAEATSAE